MSFGTVGTRPITGILAEGAETENYSFVVETVLVVGTGREVIIRVGCQPGQRYGDIDGLLPRPALRSPIE